MDASVTHRGVIFRIIVVHRLHPKHKKEWYQQQSIFDLVSKHIMLPGNLLIMEDFSIHWNIPTGSNSLKFNDIIDSFELKQHVSGPTHINAYIFDFMIHREDKYFVRNVTVTHMIFDHVIVDIKLAINKPGLPKEKVIFRKYRAIDITQLTIDILDLVVTNTLITLMMNYSQHIERSILWRLPF